MRTVYIATAGWANTGEFSSKRGDSPLIRAEYYDVARGYMMSSNQHVFEVTLDEHNVIVDITIILHRTSKEKRKVEALVESPWRLLCVGDTFE